MFESFKQTTDGLRHLTSIAEEHDGAGLNATGLQKLDPDATHVVLVADPPYDGSRFAWLYAVVAMRDGAEEEADDGFGDEDAAWGDGEGEEGVEAAVAAFGGDQAGAGEDGEKGEADEADGHAEGLVGDDARTQADPGQGAEDEAAEGELPALLKPLFPEEVGHDGRPFGGR